MIPRDERRPEREFWQEFEEARPRILGALLDVMSAGLREREHVEIAELPRMADFATWVAAASTDLPWSGERFLEVYENNRRDALAIVLDHDPLGEEIISFARLYAPWDGTPSALHAAMRGPEGRRTVPPTPAAMFQKLKRFAPALQQIGGELAWYWESDYKRTRKIAVRAVHPVQEESPLGIAAASADDGGVAVRD